MTRHVRTLAGAAAGAVAAILIGSAGVPLYDGVGFPDEPYRYVQAPPPGQPSTAPPSTARGQLHMADGVNTKDADFASAESGPQVEVFFPAKSLKSAASAPSVVDVSLTPVPLVQPPVGDVDSNVYRVELSTGGASVTPSGEAAIQIALRASNPNLAAPVMNYRPKSGEPWQGLRTSRPGFDVFGSAFTGPGEYLLAQPPTAPPASSGGRSPVVLLGVGVLIIVVLLLGVRLRSRSRTP